MDIALVGKGRWGQNYIKTKPRLLVKTRDYPELFEMPKVNGVIIASPSNTHFSIARDFLTRGFNILIEKPITKTYEEALKLQRLHLQNKKLIVMAGHIQIYDPGYQELKKQLARVGKIKKLTFKGSQEEVRADSTVLENWGPHPIYMFMDILGGSPTKATATGSKNSDLQLNLFFDSSVTGQANIILSPHKQRELSVIGEKGKLTFDWSGVKTLTFEVAGGKKTYLEFSKEKSPLEVEIDEFIECIKTGREPKTPLSQGVEVMRILNLCRN